ncbi:transient-receptor-potential-like protein [Trichonephila inaurata madagascariensis]|uniref:Transient-receptor-potential-like protein n=1 Tax=Trichonephila inaurata madagascariensis TaxID=2747483 RepID=A0A8X6MBF6_9ARAC|nr:transient-receptor-potential-like protein [Trichonephila inaurata madagascariensis]
MKENEFKEIYIELSNQCKKYSCDLLDLCRSTEEVIAVLNKKTDSGSHQDQDPDQLTLSRLKLALKYEQKQPTTLEELNANIESEIAAVSAKMCGRVMENWVQRIDRCKRARGGHMSEVEFHS